MNPQEEIHCVEALTPSLEGMAQLAALQRAVDKALDRKRRLGQYAVVWENGRPVERGLQTQEQAVK